MVGCRADQDRNDTGAQCPRGRLVLGDVIDIGERHVLARLVHAHPVSESELRRRIRCWLRIPQRMMERGMGTSKPKIGRTDEEQAKLFELLKLMGNIGVIKNKTRFRNEGDKIYAFKPQPHRFLCFFFEGQKIIVTNGFHKKADKLPKNEKERALRIKVDYETRIKRGDYYE